MNFNSSNLFESLNTYEEKFRKALEVYGETAGKKLEIEAKQQAKSGENKWQDRTALARQTIEGGSQVSGNKVLVYVAGHREYSPYLELANEKKHSVLWPAIEKLSPEIMQGLDNLLGK